MWSVSIVRWNLRPVIFGVECRVSGKKRNPNPNFLVRMSSGGVGVFHVKGWGPKSSVCPSKPRETKLFGGISGLFAWDIPGVPEKFEKEKFVFNSRPLGLREAECYQEATQYPPKGCSRKMPRSNTVFSNTSALTNSLLFRANSKCKGSRTPVWSNASGF